MLPATALPRRPAPTPWTPAPRARSGLSELLVVAKGELRGVDGVSRVLTGLSGDLAHTMALCGLGEVRSVPRDTVTRSP